MRRGPRWGEDWNCRDDDGFDLKSKTLVIRLGESLKWVDFWGNVSRGSGCKREEAIDEK